MTGILDRLENRGLIKRERGKPDRRRVTVSLTKEGHKLAECMPWPLQERFADRLSALPAEDQARIDLTLDQIVHMMSVQDIDAWPIVGSGEWNDNATQPVADKEVACNLPTTQPSNGHRPVT